jgi:FtsZ-binding cell division protein ZapB
MSDSLEMRIDELTDENARLQAQIHNSVNWQNILKDRLDVALQQAEHWEALYHLKGKGE